MLPAGYIFHIVKWIFKSIGVQYMDNPKNGAEPGVSKARGRPRDWQDKTGQNTIKSLDRAMAVFEYLSESQGKTLSVLAQHLDQSPATIHRELVTVESTRRGGFSTPTQVPVFTSASVLERTRTTLWNAFAPVVT